LKQHIVRYALGLVVLLALLGHAAHQYQVDVINRLDAIIYDTKVRLTMPETIDERIVILDIDEKSLGEIGRWPWGRDRMAELVTKLFDQYGIMLLGFDVVFAEPDDSSGLKVLDNLAKKELKDSPQYLAALKELRPQLDHDNRFTETLKGKPVILGYYFSDRDDGASSGGLPPPVLPAGSFTGRNVKLANFAGSGGNLTEFQAAAMGAGHFNPIIDFDGIARRVPLIAEYKGNYYEALSLAMVRTLVGSPKVVPWFPEEGFLTTSKSAQGMERIDLPIERDGKDKTLSIPVDDGALALIPYRGNKGSYRYISIADIFADRVKPEQLKGKIALIGTTAPGLLDLRATPVSGIYPGVEIHANLISGMLDGTLKQMPSFVLGAEVILLALAGLVMIFLLPLLKPGYATLVSFGVLLFVIGVNLAFWQFGSLVVPLASSLIMVFGLFALNMSYGYFVESRSKRQFTDLFGLYVPPELVEEMSRNPESYSMEGRSAELTVMFSDIRGFTALSEGLEPKELAALMKEYLSAMTDVIGRNRGTLDKYIGDAIMAFWGAPVDDAEHARHAVLTGMEMQAALRALDKSFAARGWPPLKIGVGINTGTMIVGDMGSKIRKAYTVLGDAVNLSSRLESITKQYGVGIIVGEATRKIIKDVVFRELDRVQVKGKDEPVSIYEPIGLENTVNKDALSEIKLWNQALRHYRGQEWDQAEVTLLNLTRMSPEQALYAIYMERVSVLRKSPPGLNWDGVWKFEAK